MVRPKFFEGLTHFIWDEHNQNKNWRKHGVRWEECEQAMNDERAVITEDPRHSTVEQRWDALGRTTEGRHLFMRLPSEKAAYASSQPDR